MDFKYETGNEYGDTLAGALRTGVAMKCREGCEGSKTSAEFVCMRCWNRLPKMLGLALVAAITVERQAQVEQEALTWLAADDRKAG